MKNTIKSIHIIIATSLLIYIIYNQRYELEFKYHIYGSTKKLVNEDFLNPTYAYLNKDKLIGIEFISTPECGEITKKYGSMLNRVGN